MAEDSHTLLSVVVDQAVGVEAGKEVASSVPEGAHTVILCLPRTLDLVQHELAVPADL